MVGLIWLVVAAKYSARRPAAVSYLEGHSKNRKGPFTKLLNGKGPIPLLSYLGSNNAR